MIVKKMDCFDDICPLPIIKIKNELKKMQLGDELLLVTGHSCTIEHIKEIYSKTGMLKDIDEVLNGVWEVTIVKNT